MSVTDVQMLMLAATFSPVERVIGVHTMMPHAEGTWGAASVEDRVVAQMSP